MAWIHPGLKSKAWFKKYGKPYYGTHEDKARDKNNKK